MRPPGSGDGGGGQESGFQVTARDASFSPSPRDTTLYGTHKVGWGQGQRERGTQAPAAARPRAGHLGRWEASAWLQVCGGAMPGAGGASGRAPGFTEPSGEHSTEPAAPPQGLGRRAPGQAHRVRTGAGGAPRAASKAPTQAVEPSDQACPHRGNSQAQQSRGNPPHGSPRRPLCELCQPSRLKDRNRKLHVSDPQGAPGCGWDALGAPWGPHVRAGRARAQAASGPHAAHGHQCLSQGGQVPRPSGPWAVLYTTVLREPRLCRPPPGSASGAGAPPPGQGSGGTRRALLLSAESSRSARGGPGVRSGHRGTMPSPLPSKAAGGVASAGSKASSSAGGRRWASAGWGGSQQPHRVRASWASLGPAVSRPWWVCMGEGTRFDSRTKGVLTHTHRHRLEHGGRRGQRPGQGSPEQPA